MPKGRDIVTMFQFKNLETYREQRLISRAEMARKTGLSPLTINKLEGGRSCRPDTAKKILESLDIILNGGSYAYNESDNDSIVYTSPSLRPNSVQLILKRVVDENERRLSVERTAPNKVGRPPQGKSPKAAPPKPEAAKKGPVKKSPAAKVPAAKAPAAKADTKTKPKAKAKR
ncbi:MAG: helix-turn-helix transcriptional regulator [Deltaproteobacteria bacterium]|jgi:DNA-binding XRE family transcriptional regulator|nr:helix-turn-helix transcriptional regulator [Deltaproteobacteria bacterium]